MPPAMALGLPDAMTVCGFLCILRNKHYETFIVFKLIDIFHINYFNCMH